METEIYDAMSRIEREHWWYRGRRAIVAEWISRYAGGAVGERRILSVGCGTGSELEFLNRFGEVTGLDADETAVAYCAGKVARARAVLGRAESLPFPNAIFDLVCAMDVFEHVGDDAAALREAWRVLKPGGLLVATVPAMMSLWSQSDDRAHHLRRYDRPGLIAKAAGWRVLRLTYFNSLLFFPLVLAKGFLRLAGNRAAGLEVTLPPRRLNEFLFRAFMIETRWLRRWNLPFGVSLGLVAGKE